MMVSLMVALTGTSPDFAPVDSGRGLAVDLNDLIRRTQRMADSADHPESFSKSFNNLVLSFRLVSGIDHHISKEKTAAFFKDSSLNMLIVSCTASNQLHEGRHIIQLPLLDHPLLMSAPPDPPPEMT